MVKDSLEKSKNLGFLGITFQFRLVKILIEEPKFFEEISSIINQNAFTDTNLRTIVGTIKDYYSEYGVVPSYDMIDILIRKNLKTQTEVDELDAIIKKIKFETSYEGCDENKLMALSFFKQQNLIKVANKILEIASTGELDRYAECQKLLEEATLVGQDDDFGFNIYDMEDKALNPDSTVSIPTGIAKLDEVLDGGLDKGKLGLIIAAAGFGKTTFTTAIDAYAATYKCPINNNSGFKVLQIYFEDDDVDITRKHYSRITGQEARTLKRLDQPNKDEIARVLNNFEDKDLIKKNLRLKHFKTHEKSASDIEVFVKRLKNTGFVPDLISIDYFECLAPEKGGYASDSEWTREGNTMRKLENMAHELNCAIWLPTQGSKDSMNSPDVVRMDQASGSAKKVHVAQVIISIARAISDIEHNKAVLSVLKNRAGKSGKIFNNVKFNNGTSTISCDDVMEYNDDSMEWEEAKQNDKSEKYKNQVRALNECRDENRKKSQETEPFEGNLVGYIGQNN